MSVVPPPMSTTMLPDASVIGMPAPIAAAIASSIRWTSLALARIALSFTARRSTWVISDGTPMTTRGRSKPLRLCAFLMKWVSIFSAASKSAMTPSFIGLIAVMLPGVRPSISLASVPTASMRPLTLFRATMDGSLTTMPRPRAKTQVLAVPRSMARSWEKRARKDANTGGLQARLVPAANWIPTTEMLRRLISPRGTWAIRDYKISP